MFFILLSRSAQLNQVNKIWSAPSRALQELISYVYSYSPAYFNSGLDTLGSKFQGIKVFLQAFASAKQPSASGLKRLGSGFLLLNLQKPKSLKHPVQAGLTQLIVFAGPLAPQKQSNPLKVRFKCVSPVKLRFSEEIPDGLPCQAKDFKLCLKSNKNFNL
jgi:hypothetical protein